MHRRCNSWRSQFMPIGQFIAMLISLYEMSMASVKENINVRIKDHKR